MQLDLNDHQRLQLTLALQQQMLGAQMLVAMLNPPAQQPEAAPQTSPQGAEPAADTPAE
jgi:hypothetical protein